MENKLRMTPDQVLERAVQAVKWALEYTDDVEFSAEDAGRSEMDFLVKVFEAVIDAGAKTINVPDTVGYNIPVIWGEKFQELIKRVERIEQTGEHLFLRSNFVCGIKRLPVRMHLL